jgi:hypothetical protein
MCVLLYLICKQLHDHRFNAHSPKIIQMSNINEDTHWTQVMPVLSNLWDRCLCLFPPLTSAEFTIDALSSDGVKLF